MEIPTHLGEDWTGRIINGIEVIGVHSGPTVKPTGKRKHSVWKLRCHCGNIFHTAKSNVVRGRQHNCIKCREFNNSNTSSVLWAGSQELPQTYVSTVELRAKTKGLDYNLTYNYLWELLEAQEFKCALSGESIGFSGSSNTRVSTWTASLDRIDSSRGYVEGNVQWVHKHVNIMKQAYSQEYFIYMCSRISEYFCNKNM